MGYELTCNSGGANTGMPKCRGDYGRVIFHIICPPGHTIDTEANALLEATWTTLIENDESTRAYPLPEYFKYTPAREDAVYEQGDFGKKIFIREGYADGTAMYENAPPCFKQKLNAFNKQNWTAYEVTEKGYILGYSVAGTLFQAFDIDYQTEADKPATGEETRKTPVKIYCNTPSQWEEYGVAIYPPGESSAWNPRELEGLLDANVTVVSSTATSLVVDVKTDCDETAVTDLVVADFLLQDDTPSTETVNSATESTTIDGRYTLDVTTLGADDYTINLKEPSAMTTNGFQHGDDASFEIES